LPVQRGWERDVQSSIRQLTPPAGPDEFLRLGFDADDALIAVSSGFVERFDDGSVAKLQLLAISASERGSDGLTADATLEEAMASIQALAPPSGDLVVIAWVHGNNGPSESLLARNGFDRDEPVGDNHVQWVRVLR
jgi:hypothetical protein